ncbi:unnamed protein product [Closterium sp. Naga37s-1]|nr:unnamed protein product [Closterium sp. Naga37s-1]
MTRAIDKSAIHRMCSGQYPVLRPPLSPLAMVPPRKPELTHFGAPHATLRIAALIRVTEPVENINAASAQLLIPTQTPPSSFLPPLQRPIPCGFARGSGGEELVESLDVGSERPASFHPNTPRPFPPSLLSPPPISHRVGVGPSGDGEEEPGIWLAGYMFPCIPILPTSINPPPPTQVVLDMAGAVKELVVLDVAGAVKEIVENSLDAGATSVELMRRLDAGAAGVEVRLKDFGAELIEVSDYGCGFPGQSPIPYSLYTVAGIDSRVPHILHLCTTEGTDPLSLSSFGFRGEALSSLCALAHVTITTRIANEPIATLLAFDHVGKLLDTPRGHVARAVRTTVSVAKIFSPLPVRRREFERNVRGEFAKLLYRSFNSLQFPAAFLNVSLSADAYDVNVTPDKRKVFLHYEVALLSGLRATLSEFYSSDRYVYRAAPAGSVAKEIEERARREVGEKRKGRRGVGRGVGDGEDGGEGGEDGEEEGEGRRKRVRVSSDSGGGAAAGA